jgi:glycosyltransferase involved in cell wall biosynthesis
MSAAATVAEWPAGLPGDKMRPPVSIVTPTYNRRKFIPMLIEHIKAQTYPLARIEWLVYDDGSDPIEDLLTPHKDELHIRYFRSDTKLNVGAKRNKLHAEARGQVLVVMDDDDYYMPDRVSHAVQTLLGRKVQIVGSTRNHMYFTDDASIWETGPFNPNHATFGTMAFTKAYAASHPCDETVTHAEELSFTRNFKEPLAQLDPMKVMLVICHKENTFNKNKLRESPCITMKRTGLKLRAFIRKATVRDFYASV